MAESETINIIVRLRDQASRGFRTLGRSAGGVGRIMRGLGGAVFSLKGALAGLGLGLKWLQVDLSGQMSQNSTTVDGESYPQYAKVNLALISRW